MCCDFKWRFELSDTVTVTVLPPNQPPPSMPARIKTRLGAERTADRDASPARRATTDPREHARR